MTRDDLERDAIADAASGGSKTYDYTCDGGCGTVMEVAEGAIRMASGMIYCDDCGQRGGRR